MFGKKTKDEKIEVTEENPAMPQAPSPAKKKEDWLEKEEEFEGQLTLDVFQDADNIIIKSTIAGVRPEDLDISINNDMLTIKGERKKEETVKEADYFYQECYWGAFSRSVILPMEVEADKIEAMLKDGVLTIKLPKSKKAKARKIQVKVGM
jgi:HSP20 family protein